MEKWAENIHSKLNTKLSEVKEKDLRFFRIDEFKRNISRTDDFSTKCSFCQKQKIDISEVVETIDEAVLVPGKTRREYDRLIARLAKHMQKEHGFYAPFYFTYLFSFFGMLAGFVLGFLLMKIFPEHETTMLLSGFALGLVAGYLIGIRRDKKIRSAKKLM